MEPVNSEEMVLLQQLRERLKDMELCDEALCNLNLVRWLRARNLKVGDAEQMLRKHLRWHDEQKLSEIFSFEPSREVKNHLTPLLTRSGYDRNGNLHTKNYIDLPELMRAGFKKEYIRLNLQIYEQNAHLMRTEAKRRPDHRFMQYTAIIDLGHLQWRQVASFDCVDATLILSRWVEENYPETCNAIVIINAPKIFYYGWTFIQPIVSERTASKIQIFGCDREKWMCALLKIAAEDQLPKKLGGILPDDTDILLNPKDCVPRKRGCY